MTNSSILLENFISGTVLASPRAKYFLPNTINRQWIVSAPILLTSLERIYIKFGELNNYATNNSGLEGFILGQMAKEAWLSNQLEGVSMNFRDVFLPEESFPNAENKRKWLEIRNYINTLNKVLEESEKKPLSLRMLKMAHASMYQSTVGKQTYAGNFRKRQRAENKALAITPPLQKYINELMGDLEEFMLNEEIKVPYLVRIAIVHYQLETICPFDFGNGKLARMLDIVYLLKKGILKKPLIIPSEFMGENQMKYFDTLNRAREKNDLYFWIRYFLDTIEQSIDAAFLILKKADNLKQDFAFLINENWGRRAPSGQKFLEYLFTKPAIHVTDIQKVCNLSKKAANDLVKEFVKSGILEEVSGQIRYRVFLFTPYVDLYKA